jgi:hypothetical protein
MWIRATVVSALALGAVALTPAVASAAPSLYAPSSVKPGETFTVSGSECLESDPFNPPHVDVDVSGGVLSGTVPVDGGGSWSIRFTMPADLGGGNYFVSATCRRIASGDWWDYPTVTMALLAPPKSRPVEMPPGVTGYPPGTNRTPRPAGVPAPGSSSSPAPAGRSSAATTTPSTTVPAPEPAAVPTETSVAATPTGPVSPTPAPGCADCDRLTGDDPLRPGEDLALAYAGFAPGEQVSVVIHSTPVDLGTFTADATGTVAAAISLPESAEAGAHRLVLTGPTTGERSVAFRLAAAVRETTAAPADEGSGLLLPVGGGAAVVVLAGVGYVLYRRRSPVAEPAG